MDKEYYTIEYTNKKDNYKIKKYVGEITDNIEKLIQEIIRHLIFNFDIGKTNPDSHLWCYYTKIRLYEYGFNSNDISNIKTWDQLIEFINENDTDKTYKKNWDISLVKFTKDDYIVSYNIHGIPQYVGKITSNLENLIQQVIRYLIWNLHVSNKIDSIYHLINYDDIDLEKYGFNESDISKIKTWDELINFIIENDYYKNDTSNYWKYPNRWDIKLISGNELCK
uniref:Uncharacterized protein n=1 Tax=viral metagenome TaxID=1070528 RepID=A0A6C0H6Z4_9ZZZZ